MCSACTSSSPSAVNSAAEQSARSLMFGLNAARRSTAPISSATPVSREISTCERRRDRRAHRPALPPAARALPAVAVLGPPARRAPRPVQSASASDARARRRPRPMRGRASGRSVDRDSGAGRRARGPQRHHLDRRVRAGRSRCGAGARRRTRRPRHGELVALARVAAVERGRRRSATVGRRRRVGRRGGQLGQRRRRARSWSAGVGPRPHEVALARARHSSPTADSTPARGGTITAAMPSASASAQACSGPAPPKATSASPRGRRPARPTPPAAPLHRRVDHRDHALGGRRRRRSSAAAGRVDVEPADAGRARRPAGMRPATRSASVTVGSVPPRP